MDKIAKFCPRFLKFLSSVGIYFAFLGMFIILTFLFKGLYDLIMIPNALPVVSPLIPGVKIPGFIYVPFWYGIISLFIVIVIHEFSHGVIARVHNIKVKSSGVGMFAIFPLAFVEPDEKELSKKSRKQQLSVYAAGPFSNILTAGLIYLIFIFLLLPFAASMLTFQGINIESVSINGSAYNAGLQEGDIVTAINGVSLNETNYLDLLSSKKPGTNVTFQTLDRNLTIIPTENLENASIPYYGIYLTPKAEVSKGITEEFGDFFPGLIFGLIEFLNWLFVLSLGIGLANLLPLGPVDGGRIMFASLTKFFKEDKAKIIWAKISLFILLLLIVNLLFPYIRKLFHPAL